MTKEERLTKLQRLFEDYALALKVAADNGKMLPDLRCVEDVCKGVAKVIEVLREDE